MENFYTGLADLLEVDRVDPHCELEQYENWDSLTILSVIVMLDADFGVTLSSTEVRNCKTAGVLFQQMQNKRNLTA